MRKVSKSIKMPLTIISSNGSFHGSDSLQWINCLKLFANEVGNRRFIVAQSGHYIFQENPKLVIDEIIRSYREFTLSNK